MKRFLTIALAVALLLGLILASPAGRGRIRAFAHRTHVLGERPLPKGQCTWYAQQRAADSGWRIRFDVDHDRHARNWWRKVVNGQRSATPAPGAVMIVDAWEGNPFGHVAYVEAVRDADHWTVTHANFAIGTAIGSREGVSVYEVDCERTSDGLRLAGSDRRFQLTGFLLPLSSGRRAR